MRDFHYKQNRKEFLRWGLVFFIGIAYLTVDLNPSETLIKLCYEKLLNVDSLVLFGF